MSDTVDAKGQDYTEEEMRFDTIYNKLIEEIDIKLKTENNWLKDIFLKAFPDDSSAVKTKHDYLNSMAHEKVCNRIVKDILESPQVSVFTQPEKALLAKSVDSSCGYFLRYFVLGNGYHILYSQLKAHYGEHE